MALSIATVTSIGLTCKAAIALGICSLRVKGLSTLDTALHSQHRHGILTVSNHISTLDDPLAWAALPLRYYLSSTSTRWTLGASDIMFTNPIFSTFFRLGQTLETFRGKGVYQPSVDTAIQKLSEGHWIHLFSEGKVNQPNTYSIDSGYAHLPRFKWGVGRILMEAPILPVIIPMWLTGFDRLMPEGRTFPYKYFPRPGAELTVTFGDPIPARDITSCLDSCLSNRPERLTAGTSDATFEASKARAAVTTLIHQRVEELGRAVSGNELAAPLSSPHQC